MNHPDPGDVFDMVSPFVLRMQVEAEGEAGGIGTCFILGRRNLTGQLIAVTAAHCIPHDVPAKWTIQRFDRAGRVNFQAIFSTTPDHAGHTYLMNLAYDVGWFVLPPQSSKAFTPADEFLPVIEMEKGTSEGSAVWWAGYSSQIEEAVGRPHLCCFAGTMCAMVNRDHPVYLIDGHVSRGVSGGPVWHWCPERKRPLIIGIVSQFMQMKPTGEGVQIPGFCKAELIQPVVGFFNWWNRQASLPPGHPDREKGRTPMKFPWELP